MEIENYLAFGYEAIERLKDQGVEPENNLTKLFAEFDKNFGTDLIGRADKIVEEAKELAFEASMIDRWTTMTNGRDKAAMHAYKYIWELSDLFALVFQNARLVAKATDTNFSEFCQLLIGAAMFKLERRKTEPDFLHDQDECGE